MFNIGGFYQVLLIAYFLSYFPIQKVFYIENQLVTYQKVQIRYKFAQNLCFSTIFHLPGQTP